MVKVTAEREEVVRSVTITVDANTARLLAAILARVILTRRLRVRHAPGEVDPTYELYDQLDDAVKGGNVLGDTITIWDKSHLASVRGNELGYIWLDIAEEK